jgi:NADPH:quinone reductase-like Zn-dependent oxidoreductase
MRAIVQRAYGTCDVLRLEDIDEPEPGPHDVLVRVHAASVNRADWYVTSGRPAILRVGFGLRRPRVAVRGRDLAGTVTRVGSAVTGFGPGEEVYAETTSGSFAEYACVPERLLATKPINLTFEQAAVPLAAVTALQGLRDVGQVQPGQADAGGATSRKHDPQTILAARPSRALGLMCTPTGAAIVMEPTTRPTQRTRT